MAAEGRGSVRGMFASQGFGVRWTWIFLGELTLAMLCLLVWPRARQQALYPVALSGKKKKDTNAQIARW